MRVCVLVSVRACVSMHPCVRECEFARVFVQICAFSCVGECVRVCIRAYFLLCVYSFVLFRVSVFIRWREFGDERASVCVFLRACVRVCVRVSFRAGVRAYVHFACVRVCVSACVRVFVCT